MNTGGHIPGKRECIFLPLIRVCPALLQDDVDEEGVTSAPVEKSRKRRDAAEEEEEKAAAAEAVAFGCLSDLKLSRAELSLPACVFRLLGCSL